MDQFSRMLDILWVNRAVLPWGWDIKGHTHDYFHLFYMKKGWADYEKNGEIIRVEEGGYILFAPGDYHMMTDRHEEDGYIYEAKFRVSDPQLADLLINRFEPVSGKFADRCISYILHNWPQTDAGGREKVYSIFHTFLLCSCRPADEREWHDSRYIDISGFGEKTVKVIEYIETNYRGHFDLNDLARALGYTKSYLCSVFKQETGITIVDYLQYVRIRMAAECFSYTGLDAYTTGRTMGYANVSYFTRCFKKLTGLPPGQYRKLFPICGRGSLGGLMQDDVFTRKVDSIGTAYANLRVFGEVAKQIESGAGEKQPREGAEETACADCGKENDE